MIYVFSNFVILSTLGEDSTMAKTNDNRQGVHGLSNQPEKLEEIKTLYQTHSTYEISRIIGMPQATVQYHITKLGLSRGRSKSAKMMQKNIFICPVCSRGRPLKELGVDRRYFPPIYACSQCRT